MSPPEPTIHLREIAIVPEVAGEGFPFAIPAVRHLERVRFETPVTFFVGENGSGKSTLLEAIAYAVESVTAGSESVGLDQSLSHVRPLGRAMRATWERKTRRGFFLRAEDFFGYVKRVKSELAGLQAQADRLRAENPTMPEGELSRISAPFAGSAGALRERYGEDMDARSHGEQFLDFFRSRLVPNGLYLLDEPEVPLSPTRQLTLLSLLRQFSKEEGCQFIIATHSPILMALPEAVILSFDETPPARVAYDDLEHVRITRNFLNRPEAFLRHL